MGSGKADETRINVSIMTREKIKRFLPRDVSYDTFLSNLIDFCESNKFTLEMVLSNEKLIWVRREITV